MKKLRFAMILFLCLGVFLCLGAAAYAEPAVIDFGTCGAEGGNLTWTLYDTGELVIDGTGAMAKYGEGTAPWYKNRLKISSVTIHDGVTSIGDWAFYDCSSLTSVTIPESVTSIGEYAFTCSSLTSVTIPESVTSISKSAFENCSSLTSVTIPDSVTSIGGSAFSCCSSLTSVTIPDSVTSIGDYAFGGCSGLTSVTIPEGVTYIGWAAFEGCNSLTDVYYGGTPAQWGTISIEDYNEPLTNATIHYVGVIDSGTCGADGDNLTWTLYDTGELVIDGTGRMADFEFYYSSQNHYGSTAPWYKNRLIISSVTIHDGVTSIGNYAFYGCRSLTSVTIPDSVTSIGESAFAVCGLTSVTIPDGVTSIGEGAFSSCNRLTSVTIPDGVTSIGNWTFSSCSGLTSVTIPVSVTNIGYEAFCLCSSLTSVTIPGSVTSIGNGAFSSCRSLASVTIPDSVTSIGEGAFSGCSGLTNVYYGGSEAQWKNISIGNRNDPLKNATIHYALESYTISYDPNGGKDAPASQQKIQNIPLTLSNVRPTKENTDAGTYSVRLNTNEGGLIMTVLRAARTTSYSFKGWNTAADGSGTDYAPGASYTADADVTLYAQWESSTTTAPVTLPELARDDGIFKGWAESRDAESGIVGEYTPTENVTLYAIWEMLYTVSYDPNGGKDAPASQQKTQNIPLTLSDTQPTREKVSSGTYSVRLNPNDGGSSSNVLRAAKTTSYSFKGWNTAADGSGTDYAPGASYTADADVTLYAQWESTTTAAPVTLPELARDDAVFKGWAESRDAESGIVGEYTPTGNVTLYAIWHRADFVLPASLNTVESEAFTGGAFTYVFIPATVERIDGNAFASCPKLAYAQFAGADTVIDATAFDGVSGLTIIAPSGSTAEAYASAHGFDFVPAA